jgi:hypothetical protein
MMFDAASAKKLNTRQVSSMRGLLPQALELLLGSEVELGCSNAEFPDLTSLGLPTVFSRSRSRSLTNRLRQKDYTHFRNFAALPSYRAPRWLLPIEASSGMLAATQIYLPHKRAARILKSLVIGIIKTGWQGWMRSRVLIASKGPLPLEVLVRDLTGEEQPIFALSFGRQAVFRKLTVQVTSPRGVILGYLKLPLTDAACQRVRNEARMLEQLSPFTVLRERVPRLLYAGNWNGSYMLFQSPLEGEAGPVNFDGIHEQFLRTLQNVHRVERPGQSLVDEVAGRWEKAAPLLGAKWSELGREVLRRATRYLSEKSLQFGIMHGDFAPWNTRVQKRELRLFDWESADWEAPTAWDRFHFHVQATSSFGKNSGHRIGVQSSGSFMLYLLSSVCEFLKEGNHKAISYRRRLLIQQLQRVDSGT